MLLFVGVIAVFNVCPVVIANPFHFSDSGGKKIKRLEISSKTLSLTENAHLNKVETFAAFISYRRSTSKHLAMLLKVMLARKNIPVFLDVEDLEGGVWNVQLIQNIKNSPNFILVLSNGTLERCKGDFNYADVLHKEIKEAVDLKKRIILVIDSFDWPPSQHFSKEINFALTNQGVELGSNLYLNSRWVHHLVDQSLERLISYMVK